MKIMRSPKLFITIAIVAAVLPIPALAQTKIGFVNTERIMRDSAPAGQASKRLEAEFAKKQKDLQKLAEKLKRMQNDLQKNAMTMSDTQRRSKEREFNELNRELNRRDRDFRDEVNQRRNEEIAQLRDRATRVIQQIAEREHYDLILQDAVYVNPRIDITDKVMKALEGKPPAK